MTRYIFIDNQSGFIWGDVDGETPEQAAIALDAELGGEPATKDMRDDDPLAASGRLR